MSPALVGPDGTPRVTLLGKPGCHLCEAAREVLAGVVGTVVTDVDVLSDPVLADQWWEQIPVVLVDGAVVGYWRIDPARVRAALERDTASGG